MSFLQLQIPTLADQAEYLSDLLLGLGALSVTFTDKYDQPIFEPAPDETPFWQELWIHAVFPADAKPQNILQMLEKITQTSFPVFKINEVEDQDWLSIWQKNFKPMQFGNRLWICPSHATVNAENAIIVNLDAGLAFGTGTHPTTQLCLEWLAENIKGGETLIDYGCGSGILALAAAKLGAEKVIAIDIDPQALIATQENAKKNLIYRSQLTTLLTEDIPPIKADIILANILLNPLLELCSKFQELLKPQGRLILTGILSSQIDTIKNTYQNLFQLDSIANKEEWVRMDYFKNNN